MLRGKDIKVILLNPPSREEADKKISRLAELLSEISLEEPDGKNEKE